MYLNGWDFSKCHAKYEISQRMLILWSVYTYHVRAWYDINIHALTKFKLKIMHHNMSCKIVVSIPEKEESISSEVNIIFLFEHSFWSEFIPIRFKVERMRSTLIIVQILNERSRFKYKYCVTLGDEFGVSDRSRYLRCN